MSVHTAREALQEFSVWLETERRASPKRYDMKKSINLWAFPYPQKMSLKECFKLAKDAGFDSFISKPIRPDQIVAWRGNGTEAAAALLARLAELDSAAALAQHAAGAAGGADAGGERG